MLWIRRGCRAILRCSIRRNWGRSVKGCKNSKAGRVQHERAGVGGMEGVGDLATVAEVVALAAGLFAAEIDDVRARTTAIIIGIIVGTTGAGPTDVSDIGVIIVITGVAGIIGAANRSHRHSCENGLAGLISGGACYDG